MTSPAMKSAATAVETTGKSTVVKATFVKATGDPTGMESAAEA
jgi:hypothetical protein